MTATHTLRARKGVLALNGYGLRLRVERGHLIAEDGAGRTRRAGRFSRVSPSLRRIIVTGSSGAVTLDAMQWLRDTGVSFTQLDHDGRVLSLNAVGSLNDVRVRRGQALAACSPGGLPIVRALLSSKLAGQCEVLRQLGGQRDAMTELVGARERLEAARDLDELRFVEARAAARYWERWNGLPIRFPTREQSRIPAHWLAFDTRRSQLSTSPRKASAPINAILNYLYGILEAEASSAACRVGCDISMGILHVDRPVRESFACDLMEPIRPHVDAYVVSLLEQHTFTAKDFFEDTRGHCRLMPTLTHVLGETAPQWAKLLGPIAERVAGQFARLPLSAPRQAADSGTPIAKHRTPLTQQNRRKSRATTEVNALGLTAICQECGCALRNPTRKYCDRCLPLNAKRASAKAVEIQAQLRQVGADRRQSAEVRAIHAEHARQQHHLNSAWEAKQKSIPSPSVYQRDIAPFLRTVSARAIADATGLSASSAKTILGGRMTPHPRHWDALRRLVRVR